MATDREIRFLPALRGRAKAQLIAELAEREVDPVEPISCAMCGASAERVRSTKKFCSVRCRVAFSRKKLRCAESVPAV